MPPLSQKTIVLGVTGSIAAYKAADLVGCLRRDGADVFVILTREATHFIGPMTLQTLSRNPVAVDLWEEHKGWHPGHIDLADRADLFLVAPATAHIIACFAHGLAPDLLTSAYLATPAPVMIAPAMNGKMYQHPATVANLRTLRERGHAIIEPEAGMLACGYEGVGRLAAVDSVLAAVCGHFEESG